MENQPKPGSAIANVEATTTSLINLNHQQQRQQAQQAPQLGYNVLEKSQSQPQAQQAKQTKPQQRRPDSLNLTQNDLSANQVSSNVSQIGADSASITTNNSSDGVITYDSDTGCWPLSHNYDTSKIDLTYGSAARLDRQAASEEFAGTSNLQNDDSPLDLCNQRQQNEPQLQPVNEYYFTIGPPQDEGPTELEDSLMYMTDGQHQLVAQSEVSMLDHDLNDGEEDEDQDYDIHKQVIVGICAMAKKAKSKPMNEILRRLEDYFEFIKTHVFEESVILNKPIEEWPLCDCLISFHSKGFPLSKAIEYARLRKPFLVNDLDIQYDIQDRRKVYKYLEEADIELPRYAVLDRDSANPEDRELIESDDHIEVANFVFNKPFVEKPISAEDHNICIYYPAHAGGGSQRLFRKIGCRSSVYSNESHVRKTGSYIYEEFMPTDGTDVKVYTAGPDYAHAEARKSPALDGKVERDIDGKEIRYPVILTNIEKLIARKVCLAFKQTVCGFDLLRANGRSYVCDVNGFSFVKSSMKYYEDCSKILGNMMLRALAPQLHIPWSIPFQLDDPPIVPTTFGRMMELRCVIAVIRHGDRTPKQKMKLEVKHQKFFELYHKYGNTKNGQAKLKKPKQLQEVLDIARYLLGELLDQPLTGEVVEPRVKLRQLKSVLEMYGHFSGINRKVQLKYQPHGRPRRSSSEDEIAREPSLVLILKWGGELTPAGRVQAEDLGRCFRRLYPASGDYSGPQGLGLLRLHSTFRHDLKIYASDEGRVQMTAAAFAKGFLALEGELTPILFQMVKSANTNGLLDNDCESSKCQKIVKERLHNIMQKNQDLTSEDMAILNPTDAPSIEAACKFISNPFQACEKVHKLIKELNSLIKSKRQDNCYTQEYHLYHGETWDLLQRRWAKLEKDFKFPRTKRFDISKIPDIYDCIKYDLQHNQHTLQFQHAHELYTYAKALADIVIPQEYGITSQEKLMISLGTCSPLLRKIQADLIRNADSADENDTESVNRLDPKYSHGVSSPDRHVRTRLYFTSESHIHSLVTALQFGGLLDVKRDEQWKRSMEFLSAISELNYLSQIVIMLYEDPTKEPCSNDRFHVEIHFSSGVINRISQQNQPTEPQGPGFRPHLHNKSYSNASSTGAEGKEAQETADTASMRSRMNVGVKQQDSMIKEEPIDEERSTDGESRANSKSSSGCITPKTVSPDRGRLEKGNYNKSLSNEAKLPSNSVPVTAQELLGDNNQTLTQTNANQLAMKSSTSQLRSLSRSYSAITPISLQDLFKKSSSKEAAKSDSLTTTDENKNEKSADKLYNDDETLAADQQLSMSEQVICPTTMTDCQGPIVALRDNQTKPMITTRVSGVDGNVGVIELEEKNLLQQQQHPDGKNKRVDGARDRSHQQQQSTSPSTPRIPVIKTNWKTHEQYLASELTGAPHHTPHQHHHHFHRRRLHNQLDQQLINLPPTYHTIHHWNISPSTITSIAHSSASMSTSPQQYDMHYRYLTYKQQGTMGKQFFTMSASMPIHYKSNQNPRACSVADVSQYCGGPSLISTAVISGSSPELAVCPYSPTIRPLETLHNELSLKQFIEFIASLTRNHRSSNNSQEGFQHNRDRNGCNERSIIEESSIGSDGTMQVVNTNSGSTISTGQQLDETSRLSSRQNQITGGASGGSSGTLRSGSNQQGNQPVGLSPGNSLSNSLIWSGPPSSFASSPGPSSPSAALELWSKLELEDSPNHTESTASGNNNSSSNNADTPVQ